MNKTILEAMVSSKNQEWETPPEIFDPLNEIFHFELDVCATSKNTKCERFLSLEDGVDALQVAWHLYGDGTDPVCWMNPPYGRQIGKWVKKAYDESLETTVVCLLPARTDTKWFHNYCITGRILFIKGRIKFINQELPSWTGKAETTKRSPALFPSMIVVFNETTNQAVQLAKNKSICAYSYEPRSATRD